ncbi:MAG: ABC transporter permease [Thaumarchaeota archaeon]|nr:ABC transporter permease [Nitrososphaerota archaeon]
MRIILLSLRVSGIATLLGACIGIPIGAVIALRTFRGRGLVISLINTLMGLPPVFVGLVFYIVLTSYGPLGFLHLLYTPEAMILAQLVMVAPLTAGVTLTSVSSIDLRLREAAVSLGAEPIQETKIILVEARLGLLTSLVVGFGAAISEVGAIMIVGGNLLGYTRALTTAVVLLTNQGEFVDAIALGLVLLGLAFSINLLLTYLQVRSGSGLFAASFSRSSRSRQGGNA